VVVKLLALFAAMAFVSATAVAQSCSAQSTAQPPALVELYTSEGCSSCPPADHWLSALKGRSDVLALAFHVNYWDRLGWPDRFATAAITERQHELQRAMGAPYVYTPQVVHNGRDLRSWRGAALPRLAPTDITVSLLRDGSTVRATVNTGKAQTLAGYWAVLEDGHTSRVKAGENAGSTLQHDHVVTLYRPLDSLAGPLALQLPAPQGGSSRRVVFVVTDAQGARPLQVAVLPCG
jgi:hypothetical protein